MRRGLRAEAPTVGSPTKRNKGGGRHGEEVRERAHKTNVKANTMNATPESSRNRLGHSN